MESVPAQTAVKHWPMTKRTSDSPKPAESLSAELAFQFVETCQRLRLLARDARPFREDIAEKALAWLDRDTR
jgi:hypothetical protein